MYNIPERFSSIKYSINFSINRLKTYLEEWTNTEAGYNYEIKDLSQQNQMLLSWDNNIQGTKNFFLVSWINNFENRTTIDLKGWITINPSLFTFTEIPLNLKGLTKYIPRKRALIQFIDLINFLKGNPEEIIHNRFKSNKFYFKFILGFIIRWTTFLSFLIVLLIIYIAFNISNIGHIGLLIDFLLILYLIHRINKKELNEIKKIKKNWK